MYNNVHSYNQLWKACKKYVCIFVVNIISRNVFKLILILRQILDGRFEWNVWMDTLWWQLSCNSVVFIHHVKDHLRVCQTFYWITISTPLTFKFFKLNSRSGVDFILVLHVPFLSKVFYLLRVRLLTNFRTKNARIKCWWNWLKVAAIEANCLSLLWKNGSLRTRFL